MGDKHRKYDKQQWDRLCIKWGMSIIRVMNYIQTKFWDIPSTDNIHQRVNYEVVNGCPVEKLHDHLIISHLGLKQFRSLLYCYHVCKIKP